MNCFSSKGSKHRNRLHLGLKNFEVAGTGKQGNCAVSTHCPNVVALAVIFQTGTNYYSPNRVRHCVWFLKHIPSSPRVWKRWVTSIFCRKHRGSESSLAIRPNWLSLQYRLSLVYNPPRSPLWLSRYRIQRRRYGHSLAPVPSQGQAAYNCAQKWTMDHYNCVKPLALSKST